ncbi:MAG: hypothetical protein JNN30_07440, partial [Rhodanobacteraceae bacterium]|nr:hypothetical protein [Rhodanobacteraceae bacterium]
MRVSPVRKSFAASLLVMASMPFCTAHADSTTPPPIPSVGIVPANVLLAEHSNWFSPPKIYSLRNEHYPLPNYPADLSYEVYSAVGFDLANTILIQGPKRDAKGNRELIVI